MATAPRTAATPTIVAPPADTADDVFASAFADLTTEDAPTLAKKDDPVVEGAVAAEGAKAEADPKVEIKIEGVLPEPGKVGADGKTVVEGTAAAETKEGEQLTDEQLLARFRAIVAEPPKPAPAPAATPAQAAPPQPETRPAVSEYSADQQKLVDTYMTEWPDVYAAEQLIRAKEYQVLVQHIFNQFRPILSQLQSQTGQMAQQSHLEQLEAAVPDYNEVAPKVVEWVGKQPAYLKTAFEHVIANGTVADVTDLIGRYRTASGEAAPAATAKVIEIPAPAAAVPAKVIKGLAPVGSKRTGVQTDAIQLDDFDGAFSAFAKSA